MAEYELVIRAERAVTPDGVRPATVAIRGGRIAAIAGPGAAPDAVETVALPGSEVLLPGLVDTHVHVNEPGRTEWEGFATATRAAAAGGVTTLIDMPLNSLPPTTTTAALAVKRAAARPSAHVDVGFWGGAVPGNLADLAGLHQAGVFGFKAFLADSGVPEFGLLDHAGLDAVLAETARLGALLIVHAEDPGVLAAAPDRGGPGVRRLPGVASRGGRGHRDRGPAGRRRAARRPGAHPAPGVGQRAAADRGGPRGRCPGHGRDLPALPEFLRRGDARRRDRVQVLPADHGTPRTGRACGPGWPGA